MPFMGTSIVLELQRLASDGQASVSDLLRKSLIVATKLRLHDFREWIQSELNGYTDKELPEYRNVSGRLSALVPGVGERPLPFGQENDSLEAAASTAPIFGGVAELEQLAEHRKVLHVTLNSGHMEMLHRLFGNNRFIPQLVISPAAIRGIIDKVRNIVLEWSLRLESEGILGDGMTFSEDEKKKAEASPAIHIGNIENFGGVLGNVYGQNVQIGDYGTIHEQLKQAGISQAERNELENIMDSLKTAKPQDKPKLVQRGMDWVGKNAANLGAIGAALMTFFKHPHQ